MAKPHWQVLGDDGPQGWGCQHTDCFRKATRQWHRASTEAEITADTDAQGPYGDVYRNPTGPHTVAVFACDDHALTLDDEVKHHVHDCPAPDPGCVCE